MLFLKKFPHYIAYPFINKFCSSAIKDEKYTEYVIKEI
jgi:hypothetical protein